MTLESLRSLLSKIQERSLSDAAEAESFGDVLESMRNNLASGLFFTSIAYLSALVEEDPTPLNQLPLVFDLMLTDLADHWRDKFIIRMMQIGASYGIRPVTKRDGSIIFLSDANLMN